MRHGFVQSFDGTRIFFSTEGQGKPLIFVYGLVCSSLHWTYQIDAFRRTHQTVWFDYRGHQNSDAPKDLSNLTLEGCARDLEAVMDALQIERAPILGHSMGVNVALEFYRRNPSRVEALVLANGTPKRPLETLLGNNMFQGVFQALKRLHTRSPGFVKKIWKTQKGNPLARSLITYGGFNPHLSSKEDIAFYVDEVSEMDPAILIQLISNYDSIDCTPWLHDIKVPTLIIAGEEDKVTPRAQQELMHQLIAGSRMEIIKHGSHCPQMDLPDLVNSKIADFLKCNGL